MSTTIIPFHAIRHEHLLIVGSKNASLGMVMRDLTRAGVRAPDGFAVVTRVFREQLRRARVDEDAFAMLDAVDPRDADVLERIAAELRERIVSTPLDAGTATEIADAYRALSWRCGEQETDVAVRSSAIADDLPEASFPGQLETYLNIRGTTRVLEAVVRCMASLFSVRAIKDRRTRGFAHGGVTISVGIQKMVRSDLASAGAMFTLDTESGFRDVVQITGAWGLGESVVQGRVCPDEMLVHKPSLLLGYSPILQRRFGSKSHKLVYADGGGTRRVPVAPADQFRIVLDDREILTLASWGVEIETHGGRNGRPTPMAIEWAKDGITGELFIVQARHETARRGTEVVELFRTSEPATPIVTGTSVGTRIGHGAARVLHGPGELSQGEVLVAPMTDATWEPVLSRAAAVITESGGRTCHAATLARELGIPCVVGCDHASERLATGDVLTVSCAEGSIGRVYRGKVTFKRDVIDPAALPASQVPIMLDVATPETAFTLGQIPSAGVGLARIDGILASQVALAPGVAAQYASPSEMFVERLASGIARIGAAFAPRPVLVRFSETSSDGLALECRALLRVRDRFGLRNVKALVPCCHTLHETRRVLAEMKTNGLVRGVNGLEVHAMTELPTDVRELAGLFDGFAIGSHGLPRHEPRVVEALLGQLIDVAHRCGRPVGLCDRVGDQLELASFVATHGIDSISVSADALPRLLRHLAQTSRPAKMRRNPRDVVHDARR